MSPAAKLSIVLELYDSGFFCKCSQVVEYIAQDEIHSRLEHEKDCIGIEEVKRLLDLPLEQK